ncbi:MAG: T9SS type A sorting domain-containing protein [Candidatus Eisenbacteria sp.]|nr:T9SS type A sorting domain-containing protein [Candidatus Eisenbacteria bacterium]
MKNIAPHTPRRNGRIRLALAGSLLLLAATTIPALGAEQTFTFEVPAPELRQTEGGTYFAIEGFGTSTTPHYPVLPTRRVAYEIPFAATEVTASIQPNGLESLGIFDSYLMRTPPLQLGNPDYQPPPAPENLPAQMPSSFAYYSGERVFRGHRLIEMVLSPLQFHYPKGEIYSVGSYTIRVDYTLPVTAEASFEAALASRSPAFEPLATNVIENYAEANAGALPGEPQGRGATLGSRYDLTNPAYAIITTTLFEDEAELLADWKTKKGTPTAVYLLSWIESTFPGTDTPEKIRNFLRFDNSTPRFDYVLLLGDSNTIPTRYCWSQDGDVPCDYYYSDVVDGAIGASYDWDTDNDHAYGEFDDTITWLPDTYVGRIASRSVSEVVAIINNIIAYEKTPPSGNWMNKAVFGAAFANYPTTSGYDPTDMANVAEWVRDDFITPAGLPHDRLYEAGGLYPTSHTYDYPLTAGNFESRVGLGCGLAFPSGHGNYLGNYRLLWDWDNGNGTYDDGEGAWEDLCTQDYNPSTGGEKPFVLVGACLAGEFDRTEPCLGDFIIANWGIGAVASNRTSYYCVGWDDPDWPWNQGQEYRWWEEIFANGKYRLGQIHGDNRYHYAQDFNSLWDGDYGPDADYASRKNMFTSTLFGDPELPIWTDEPIDLVLSHPATLPTGSSAFEVAVTSGRGPVEGATVCLWKYDEVYLVATTNPSGVASFSPDPSSGGTMSVTATKHNYIPHEGSATVEAGDTEAPTVTVFDPNGGESWAIGSEQAITWTASDNIGVLSISILLSTDNGASFPTTIATGEPNDGSFTWSVPASPTTNARVKVIAYDDAGNPGEDASDDDFTIADGTAPTVTVTSPNGGEGWDTGETYTITWTATDNLAVTGVDLLLSTDGGASFPDTIAIGEGNDGQYDWLVPLEAVTESARIKVLVRDGAGNAGEDASDDDFAIHDPASGIEFAEIPTRLELAGAAPNPLGPHSTIRFGIPKAAHVSLDAFDITGRRALEITRGGYSAGYHTVSWPTSGQDLGAGIYFLRLQAGGKERTRRIVVSQ